jgi:hypothetical protein
VPLSREALCSLYMLLHKMRNSLLGGETEMRFKH